MKFCEQGPAEDGGLVGEVTVENGIMELKTRVPPHIQFLAGPGDSFISCTVTGATTCDPVGHASEVVPDSGGLISFPITDGTVSLTNFNIDLVLTNIVTTNPDAPPINSTGTCCTACQLTQ